MKRRVINNIILFATFLSLLSASFVKSARSNEQMDLNSNGPILNFYFDKQSWLLYLENIGDETAFNITILINIEGFIVFGNVEDFSYNEQPLEPGHRRAIIYLPFVFGFGPIEITYTASALNAEPTSFTLKAFLIGPFLFLWR